MNLNLLNAELLARANASGMTVEEYVQSVLQGAVLPIMKKTLSAEERAAAFEAWSVGHNITEPLSEYAVSREGIYEGRSN